MMPPNSNDNGLTEPVEPQAARQWFRYHRDRMSDWAKRLYDNMPSRLTPTDAMAWLEELQFRANLHEDGNLVSRFLMGELARRIREDTPHGEIRTMYNQVGDAFGLGTRTLRYCIGVAEAFHGNLRLFDRWLRTGPQKHWYHMIEATRLDEDPSIIGVEAFTDLMQQRLENAAQQMQRTNDALEQQQAPEGSPEHDAYLAGQMVLTEEAVRHRRLGQDLLRSERAQREDVTDLALEAFEDMLRHMHCMGCQAPPPSAPHHPGSKGKGLKKYHWLRAPLCEECHTLYHTEGHAAFKKETGVDIRACCARTLHIWQTGEDPRFPAGLD